MSYNDREKKALRRMQWLTDQVLASEDPITDAQLEQFGKNPGVIIPRYAVSLQKLPDKHGEILSPVLADDGRFAYLTTIYGEYVIVIGNEVFSVHQKIRYVSQHRQFKLIDVQSGLPIWIDSHQFDVSDHGDSDEWDLQTEWTLMRGDETLIRTQGVRAFILLDDGSLVYTRRTKENGLHETLRYRFNGGSLEQIMLAEKRPFKSFNVEHGEIWGFWDEGKTTGSREYWCGRINVDGEKLVCDPEVMTYVNSPCHQSPHIRATRHQQKCYVLDGNASPAFNWVSRPFNHPVHGLCYLGLIDRHVVTMVLTSRREY